MVIIVYILFFSVVIVWYFCKIVYSVLYLWVGVFIIGSGLMIVILGCFLFVVNWLNFDYLGIFWSLGVCWDKCFKSYDNFFLLDFLILFLLDWY